jgi:signal peptidase I
MCVLNPFHSHSLSPLARVWGIDVFRAASVSMEPTLNLGEIFISTSWPYLSGEPRVGDIVTFEYPMDTSVRYVKRVVATGGDRIAMSRCVTILNGRALPEPYVSVDGPGLHGGCELDEVQVPKGQYFLLGDNRLQSADSRHWGPVPRRNILGRVKKP